MKNDWLSFMDSDPDILFSFKLLLWFSSCPSSNLVQDLAGSMNHGSQFGTATMGSVKVVKPNVAGFGFPCRLKRKSSSPAVILGKISSFTRSLIWREAKRFQQFHVLSLAAALVPQIQNLSSNLLAGPLQNSDVQTHGSIDQIPREVESQGCARLSIHKLNMTKPAVEPKTGIEFPVVLENVLPGDRSSRFNSEVLVGTGSRIMTIVKIKSLKLYAFGFYVHPYSLCEKLGAKYASISADELNSHHDFYHDLLREDINMTVRFVVNCKGMKINSVKDAFEKSLQARLVKTNPSTDFHCLTTFGSYFTEDIPLPLGTVIKFRRTVDGHLITERAFFDMYIGDVPVSEQTKEEIGRNVADIIRRC
ncbi:unnamed protein product [Lupinus luteus]|uniref:Chalcone isomerase domain-containing protein n=1 Tax=Lupinus luteus TaxID=3873 RepID=A0AAV1YG32_LUPLU